MTDTLSAPAVPAAADSLSAPFASPALPEERIQAVANSINLDDPALSVTFGTETMKDIAGFADSILSKVRAKDAGGVGETLTDLMVSVKDMDLDELDPANAGFLQRLPLIGSLFNPVKRTLAKFSTLSAQVEVITGKLEEAMVGLMRDIEVLEQLYEHNKSFHNDLTVYIEAGKQRLATARDTELPRLKAEADASGDTMAAQRVRDFAERINRFERRLHDLELSRTITVQTAPQIRLIQGNDQSLAEKIQTSILSTIPLWKSQMVLALSLQGQQQTAEMQKRVADATNELISKNASMLESATVETATQVERSVVDIETLREVHKKLISTIEETLRISEEGRNRRVAAAKELTAMEEDLRVKLTTLASSKTESAMRGAMGTADVPAVDGEKGA